MRHIPLENIHFSTGTLIRPGPDRTLGNDSRCFWRQFEGLSAITSAHHEETGKRNIFENIRQFLQQALGACARLGHGSGTPVQLWGRRGKRTTAYRFATTKHPDTSGRTCRTRRKLGTFGGTERDRHRKRAESDDRGSAGSARHEGLECKRRFGE